MANYAQIKKIVDAEKRELDQQLKEEGDSVEGSFVQEAMQLLMVNNTILCIISSLSLNSAKMSFTPYRIIM